MLLVLVSIVAVAEVAASSVVSQTRGEVWPKAQYEQKQQDVYHIDLDKFQFKIPEKSCRIVTQAITRCKQNIDILKNITKKYQSPRQEFVEQYAQNKLHELQIHLSKPCKDDEYPYFGMNESYNLTVAVTSVLSSSSVWGILRGLETFSQLFYLDENYKEVLINATKIVDFPQYQHRGFLLETSRHYISVDIILKLLDAMAMNKMNVFHWHIIDNESFPYVSGKFPELSKKGAFFPTLVYKKADMERVRDYARNLGIRIVMEIDMPGHGNSWSKSHPEIFTKCKPADIYPYEPPMNPTTNKTYNLLRDLLNEVQQLFPDNHLHLGGDEVQTKCWTKDAEVVKFMKKHHITNNNQLRAYFYKNVFPLLKKGTVPMVWQDVFDANVPLNPNTVVNVWSSGEVHEMIQVLKAGLKGVQSSGPYYLDYFEDFKAFYIYEPRLKIKKVLNNDTLLQNLIGAETSMWGQYINDNNVVSRVWPRTSAMAEVAWSVTDGSYSPLVERRIEEHACRMIRRGINTAPPTGPGYCVQ